MNGVVAARRIIFTSLLLLSGGAACGQPPQLNDLATRISKEIKPLKPHLVAVVDFRPADGTSASQGHYLAALLSTVLKDQEKKKFTVADHWGFDADLERLRITPAALVPGDSLRSALPGIGADILIIGSVEKRGNSYVLQLSPLRVATVEALATLSATIESNNFLESMLAPFPPGIPKMTSRQQVADIVMPSCLHCPDPSYTDPARRARINGTAILEVLISTSGDAAQIRPLKIIGYGLDEKAYDVIKKWKFRPATSRKDGKPVTVIVPIEVTFRLY